MKSLIKKLIICGLVAGVMAPGVYAQTPVPTPSPSPKTFKAEKARAFVGEVKLDSKDGTTLKVSKDGKTYTILTDDKTQFRRRFWGKGTLAEMQVGDMLWVIGKWTDDTHTSVLARLVRDLSLQKRRGTFVGVVQSLTSTGWIMQTVNRGLQTVTISGTTQADVKVGDRVKVQGLWDKTNSTITEVTKVKDFGTPKSETE